MEAHFASPTPTPTAEQVEAHFGVLEAEQWWPAVVTKVWASGEMDVRYDDGDVELKKACLP